MTTRPPSSDSTTPRSSAGLALICIGGVAAVPGGFGVAFRASGIGYLPQSTMALLIGLSLLAAGLRGAKTARRALFDTAPSVRFATAQAAPRTSVRHDAPRPWTPSSERVRVPAWTVVDRALPVGVPAALPVGRATERPALPRGARSA